MPAALSVRDLFKSYSKVQALAGVSFEVGEGEIFGLLGPNGAGKTTTIECVLGLRPPDGGRIHLGTIDALKDRSGAKQFVGAQLQGTALQDKITPREALRLFGAFYRTAIPASDLIERFELEEKADAPFDSLSGGQKQRLGLALAFVNDPRLVILDEPTAGLDPQARKRLDQLIRAVREAGKTVLLSTHDIEQAQSVCDRVAMMDRGKIVALGTPAELGAGKRSLEEVFLERTGQRFEPGSMP